MMSLQTNYQTRANTECRHSAYCSCNMQLLRAASAMLRLVRILRQKIENSAHRFCEFCANSVHFSRRFFHFKNSSRIAVLLCLPH